MASSGKFDLSSVSPDRPLYSSAQRGPYTAASLDRSASFRENNMENPILSSLPSMSRSTSTVTQVDVTNFLQCLRFDPKSMEVEHKFNRHGDFKRLASSVLGSPDESPSGSSKGKPPNSSDDLKRLKAGLRESTIKASSGYYTAPLIIQGSRGHSQPSSRERVKVFSETLSVINKCFPNIHSRKRSRPDGLPGDRSSGLLLNRAPMGTGVSKMGTQNHSLNTFDFDQQKVEDRGKNVIPSKRTRTSLVDQRAEVRPNTPARSSGNASQSEERTGMIPIVADGWEKGKMKKKRTGIKADTASNPNTLSTKPIDGYREPKKGMHQRHLPDSHGFRPGIANGIIGGKTDGPTQQPYVGLRSSIPRPEQENRSSTSSDKERTNLRSVNKSNVREEFISGSPTSTTKLHATVRGPRSGSNMVPKSSTVGQRATDPNPGPFGPANRKRTHSARSSSPPVAQWADRRPQKISRAARRTNFVPILSNSPEIPDLDTSDVTGSESGPGPGFNKRFISSNSPQQFKSESEESGAAEIRSRDKGKKCDVVVEKSEQNVQKLSTLVPTVKKNKIINGEDGVRRQGRTGRGFGSVRAVTPTVDKNRSVGIAKQLRTARLGFDKSESKLGRPPTRKLSDRKAYTRQKHSVINPAPEFLVGSVDGHEELRAAANAVINPNRALSSPFWRQMEPLFGFVSDVDMSYLKQQGNNPVHLDHDTCGRLPNGTETKSIEQTPEAETDEIPLCQRLLAALISEEENEDEHVYESNSFNHRSLQQNYDIGGQSTGFDHSSYNGVVSDSAMTAGKNSQYGIVSDSAMTAGINFQFGNMPLNERLLLEIQSIGLYPQLVSDLPHNGNEDINSEIRRLEKTHHEQISKKKNLLENLLESTNEARELQEKEFEQRCLDKLTSMAYQKYMSCWGPHAPKNVGSKVAKQAALGFVKRTLDRCHEFELTGKSCFNEPLFKEIFRSGSSQINESQADAEFNKIYGNSVERVSGTQLSPSLTNYDVYSPNTFHISEQTVGKDEIWSNRVNRVKKRELYIDVVAGTSNIQPTLLNNAKGKRSELDRDDKGAARNGTAKIGRPASGNIKGERKNKSKLKQKTAQIGKFSDQNRTFDIKEKDDHKLVDNEEEPLDFSHLQIPEMDVLGEQGEDIGSWLNIDDEILQDDDFMGLEIPMDDLSDLNMMV